MSRRGLSRKRIADLVGAEPATVGCHLVIALQAGQDTASRTRAPRPAYLRDRTDAGPCRANTGSMHLHMRLNETSLGTVARILGRGYSPLPPFHSFAVVRLMFPDCAQPRWYLPEASSHSISP